jgi:hypothetical protein
MTTSELLILTAGALTAPEWQSAIDAQAFIVPLVLNGSDLRPAVSTYQGELGGEPISFVIRQRALSALHVERSRIGADRLCYATPTSGDLKSCAAGGIALWAYGTATGGVIVDPTSGEVIAMEQVPLQQHLDAMLAAAFDRERDYEARYPSDPREHNQPVAAVATLAP